jgi:hypothetical protein
MIAMIAVASLFKFGAEMSVTTPLPMTPRLKASAPISSSSPMVEVEHLPSYYDPMSSHYMGGAHNVALAHLSGSPPSDRLNA